MVGRVTAWTALGCLCAAHLVGVFLRIPAAERMGRSGLALIGGIVAGGLAGVLFRRLGRGLAEQGDEARSEEGVES